MKAVELPAYRAFMFAVVPQLYQALPPGPTRLARAIDGADNLWTAIDARVRYVAEKLEND